MRCFTVDTNVLDAIEAVESELDVSSVELEYETHVQVSHDPVIRVTAPVEDIESWEEMEELLREIVAEYETDDEIIFTIIDPEEQ